MRKLTLNQINLLKFLRVLLVLFIEWSHNFLLNKGKEEKISLKMENAEINSVHQCQLQHGVIWTQ